MTTDTIPDGIDQGPEYLYKMVSGGVRGWYIPERPGQESNYPEGTSITVKTGDTVWMTERRAAAFGGNAELVPVPSPVIEAVESKPPSPVVAPEPKPEPVTVPETAVVPEVAEVVETVTADDAGEATGDVDSSTDDSNDDDDDDAETALAAQAAALLAAAESQTDELLIDDPLAAGSYPLVADLSSMPAKKSSKMIVDMTHTDSNVAKLDELLSLERSKPNPRVTLVNAIVTKLGIWGYELED